MDIRIFPDAAAVASAVADLVCACLSRNPAATLALASGRTPIPIYALLRDRCARGEASFGEASVFALDEYLGFGAGDAGAFATFFEDHVLRGLDLPRERAFIPDGRAKDPGKECRAFEARILAAGGLDFCLLGIGRNGHLAFNEPGPALAAGAHVAEIADETRSALPPSLRHVRFGITMGMATLMNAREIVIVATGEEKAEIVARTVVPLIDPLLPASFLQLHPRATLVLDGAAARYLVGSFARADQASREV